MISPTITAGLNFVVLALTPIGKWKAARQLKTNFEIPTFVIIAAIVVGGFCIAMLVVACFRHCSKKPQKKKVKTVFYKCAEERGLSWREHQMLQYIASGSDLGKEESIFTLPSVFDRGVATMAEECLAIEGVEKSKLLRSELAVLREKLGFDIQHCASVGVTMKSKKLSSKRIRVGEKLYISTRKNRKSKATESLVIRNNREHLMIKLNEPVEDFRDEHCRVQYYSGPSVWEFDTSVVECKSNVLVLEHSDDIWLINRRRFQRVPVNRPAYIALVPSTEASVVNAIGEQGKLKYNFTETEDGLVNISDSSSGNPELTPAVITELGGPGLRIDVSLDVKKGDDVFVAFRLDEERQGDSGPSDKDSTAPVSTIVEGIGVVRDTKPGENGLSIAVEMVGLDKSDVNRLIRATNIAAMRDNGDEDADSKNQTTEPVGQKVAGRDK